MERKPIHDIYEVESTMEDWEREYEEFCKSEEDEDYDDEEEDAED